MNKSVELTHLSSIPSKTLPKWNQENKKHIHAQGEREWKKKVLQRIILIVLKVVTDLIECKKPKVKQVQEEKLKEFQNTQEK